jgi:hypothetical protein
VEGDRRNNAETSRVHRWIDISMSVTFALICYNQEKFIREAVRGALAQDYQPLEVLISDDHSTDATFDIIQEEVASYNGPHTIRLLRNSENIGFENFARTAEAARGEFVVGAHGDDISHAGRTRCLVDAWHATNASLLSSNAEVIDARSRVLQLHNPDSESRWIAAVDIARDGYSRYADGASLAWHRDVYLKFGRLDGLRLRGSYDHVLPFRASMLSGVYYVPTPLLQRRKHEANYGLESLDRTQGDLVKEETMAVYKLGARICMLDDLDYYFTASGAQTHPAELRDALVAAILGLARSSSVARNKLFAAGKRPTWISHTQMERHPDYAKGYLGIGKGKKSRLTKLRRILTRALKPTE